MTVNQFAELGVSPPDSIECDECGEQVDVSGAVTSEQMLHRITKHGVSEHDWGTKAAGLRHLVRSFGEYGQTHYDDLSNRDVSPYEVDIYGDVVGAVLAREISAFLSPIRRSEAILYLEDILTFGDEDPTEFRRDLTFEIDEALTRGATLDGLEQQFTTLSSMLASRDTDAVLQWAAKGGEYRE